MTTLAALVRRRRLELRLTQRAAARRAAVSLATWQSVERTDGDPDGFQDLTLARIAHGLELELPIVFQAAGRPLPDPGRFDEHLDSHRAELPGDIDQLITELADTLAELARRSPDSFLLVHGQATEAAQHLLELRKDTDDDTNESNPR